MALKDLFNNGKNVRTDTVLTPEEDIDPIDGDDSSYHTVMTPYPVGQDADAEDIEEEDESILGKSSIRLGSYDTYSLQNLTEVVGLVKAGYSVFISFEALVAKYRNMSLDKAEVEVKSKAEITQFCNAILGAKIALNACFDRFGEYTYIFAPHDVDVAKIKGESRKTAENESAE